MKKIFTLCLGLVLTAAVFAAERRPDVSIISAKRYEIVIDGRTYVSGNRMMNIENLRNGRHSIQVFEVNNRSFSLFKRKQLVASRTFMLRGNDMRIQIDRFGNLSFMEKRMDRFERDFDDRDDRRDGRNRRY